VDGDAAARDERGGEEQKKARVHDRTPGSFSEQRG
jgi:hypothetical protein